MDSQFDPCDNFYDFACGSFIKNTRIPDDKDYVDAITALSDEVQEQIRTVIEEPIKPEEPRPFVLAKTFYQACMDTPAIEARGVQPLLDMLKHLGGWPVLDGDEWVESTFSWNKFVYNCRFAGYPLNYILDVSVVTDAKNSTKRIIALDQASLGLKREYLNRGLSDKLVQSYHEYMVDIAVLLGADRTRAKTELQHSLEFEINLANIILPLEGRRYYISLYNPMTIKRLQNHFPTILWENYINQLLDPLQIDSNEVINVKIPKYIKSLEFLLANTQNRTLANYVMWRVVSRTVPYLTAKLRKRKQAFDTALSGKTKLRSRWKECVNLMRNLDSDSSMNSFHIAIGALYIKKYSNEYSKSHALQIVKSIRSNSKPCMKSAKPYWARVVDCGPYTLRLLAVACLCSADVKRVQFRNTLTEIYWMDAVTKRLAIEKGRAISEHVAYPSELLDDRKLTEFYQGLEISSDKFMESVLNLTQFHVNSSFRKLRNRVTKGDWINYSTSADINVYYIPSEISISIPAGILQGVFFSTEHPAYMNYGAIGSVVGHQITHGFDDKGSQIDKYGNLVNWWNDFIREKYKEKVKCFIDQYSNYTEHGIKLNATSTRKENIADNVGIWEAYYAYQAWTRRYGEEARLPGLEKYTPKQMFWLSYASIYCSAYRNSYIKDSININRKTPNRFRVVGPLSNMVDFADDFHCPEGSYMNPVNKCKLW